MMNDHVKLFTFLVWCKCPGMSEAIFFIEHNHMNLPEKSLLGQV